MQPQQPQNNPDQNNIPQQIATSLGVGPQPPTPPTTYVVTQPVQTFAAIPEKKSPLITVLYVVLGIVVVGSAGLLAAVIILM